MNEHDDDNNEGEEFEARELSAEEINEILDTLFGEGASPEDDQQRLAEAIEASPYSVVGGAPIHPESIPPVHDYQVTLTFSTRDERKSVDQFFENLLPMLPNGTQTTITTSGEVINVSDLSWSHVGSRIRIFVEGRTVEGKLEGLYTSGVGSGISQTLIIDGKAWSLSFGVAELNV